MKNDLLSGALAHVCTVINSPDAAHKYLCNFFYSDDGPEAFYKDIYLAMAKNEFDWITARPANEYAHIYEREYRVATYSLVEHWLKIDEKINTTSREIFEEMKIPKPEYKQVIYNPNDNNFSKFRLQCKMLYTQYPKLFWLSSNELLQEMYFAYLYAGVEIPETATDSPQYIEQPRKARFNWSIGMRFVKAMIWVYLPAFLIQEAIFLIYAIWCIGDSQRYNDSLNTYRDFINNNYGKYLFAMLAMAAAIYWSVFRWVF